MATMELTTKATFGAIVIAWAPTAFAQDVPERFSKPADPPAGFARVHVFRPELSSMGKHDSPTLVVNGRELGKLDYASYSELVVRPGIIRYALKPSLFASSSWNIEGTVEVREGQTYYLAVWTAGDGGSNDGMRIIPVGGPLAFLPVLSTTAVTMRVLTEVVEEDAALEAIRGLSRVGQVENLD